jgi:hypothetical protein
MENELKTYLLKEQLPTLQGRAERGEITAQEFREAADQIIAQLREPVLHLPRTSP